MSLLERCPHCVNGVNHIFSFSIFQLHPQVVQRLTGPLPPPSHPPLPPSSKVPIITNYAPQLPMGPGPILPFPFSYPQIGTPPTASTSSTVSSHSSAHKRQPDSVEAMRETKRVPSQDEELALHNAMRQHQQQKQFLQAQAHAHAQLGTPHLVPG